MEALIMNAAIPSPARFPNCGLPATNKLRSSKVVAICCLRKNGEENRMFDSPLNAGLENQGDGDSSEGTFQPSNFEVEAKQTDIWRLFKEAQQNILYLNKQRIKALEELDRANRENQLLLDRIDQLEVKNQGGDGRDRLSVFWKLLLRIDSMVMTNVVNVDEASILRKSVMDSRAIIADILSNDVLEKGDSELLAELRNFANGSRRIGYHIVHICTEMEPLVSIGSLASYITGLSRALQRKGHVVEVILPKYSCLKVDEVQCLQEIKAESYSYFNGQLYGNKIWTGVIYGIGVTLIEPLYLSFFTRDSVYGYSDDFERFIYFSRASLDYLVKSGKKPDVIHVHNWETSVVGPLFWDIFVKQGLERTRILLTCHDLKSQNPAQPDKLALCGLDPARLHRPDRLQDNLKSPLINLLKGGVVYSNKVIIMSSLHSKGRILCNFGHGLETTLELHKEKLLVAPPGLSSKWDPCKDIFLPKTYSAGNMEGKIFCKFALQERLSLPVDVSAVLVGCIFEELSDTDRSTIKRIVWSTGKKGIQFVFLRMDKQRHDRVLESFLEEIKDENVRFISRDDEALSHLILAGSDIMLCPLHDAMHQVPLKALKYGAAPITIISDEDRLRHHADHEQLITSTLGDMSISQAIDELISNPSKWKRRLSEVMEKDFSWDWDCSDLHISAYAAVRTM